MKIRIFTVALVATILVITCFSSAFAQGLTGAPLEGGCTLSSQVNTDWYWTDTLHEYLPPFVTVVALIGLSFLRIPGAKSRAVQLCLEILAVLIVPPSVNALISWFINTFGGFGGGGL